MSQTALTYRDYEALPNDGRRYEIHDGELSVTPPPSHFALLLALGPIQALSKTVQIRIPDHSLELKSSDDNAVGNALGPSKCTHVSARHAGAASKKRLEGVGRN